MNDENGADSTVGEDSDSTKAYKSGGIIPPAKEKKKPFFKKVNTNHSSEETLHVFISSMMYLWKMGMIIINTLVYSLSQCHLMK